LRIGRAVGQGGAEMPGAGIAPIAHLEGGLAAWKDAGLEWIGTDMSTGAPKAMTKG